MAFRSTGVTRCAPRRPMMGTDSTSESKASARPSSSTSELFGGLYARGEVAAAVSDEAWVQALLDVEAALGGELLRAQLAVQMGGPVGHRDPAVAGEVAQRLGLAEPALPWHTNRVRPAQLACALGLLAGALSKPARDVTLLEGVREGVPGRGESSAMAHKRNPVAAVSVLACAKRVPGLVATMLACMEQELDRAAGAWQ